MRARDHALAPFVWLAVTLLFYIIVFGPLFEYAYRLQY